jgi:hypothetical protein
LAGGGTREFKHTVSTPVGYIENDKSVRPSVDVLDEPGTAIIVLYRSGEANLLGITYKGDARAIFRALQRNYTSYTMPDVCNM